ncbi:MAG: hypothetical protein ACTSQV_06040, partial [Alphaproteobacteria bacterium]
MAGNTNPTSIEDILAEAGKKSAKSSDRSRAKSASDNKEKPGAGSIEAVMAAAEEERKKKTYKTFASTQQANQQDQPRQTASA